MAAKYDYREIKDQNVYSQAEWNLNEWCKWTWCHFGQLSYSNYNCTYAYFGLLCPFAPTASRNHEKWLVSSAHYVKWRGWVFFSVRAHVGRVFSTGFQPAWLSPLLCSPVFHFLSVTTGSFLPSSQLILSSLWEAVPVWYRELVTPWMLKLVKNMCHCHFMERSVLLHYKQNKKKKGEFDLNGVIEMSWNESDQNGGKKR